MREILKLGAGAMGLVGVGMIVLSLWGVDVPIGLACALGSTGAILVGAINAISPAENNDPNNTNNSNDKED